jgi:hypothetical protein
MFRERSPRFLLSFALLTMMVSCTLSLANADNSAYVTTSGTFGTVDLNTGIFTAVATTPYLRGLGELNGVLYGDSNDLNPVIYQINTTTGAVTPIGAAGVALASWFGSTTTGLFALSAASSNASLYSINPSTGAATLIGPTGLTTVYGAGPGLATTGGLSVGAQALYAIVSNADGLTANFYSVNTATGTATLINTISVGVCLKGMAFVNGTLYAGSGYCTAGSQIYSIDPATGTAAFVANAAGYPDLEGLAPVLATTPVTVTSSPSGASLAVAGTGCAPGTYTTPANLTWSANTSCTLSFASPQTIAGTQYNYSFATVSGLGSLPLETAANPLILNSGTSALSINTTFQSATPACTYTVSPTSASFPFGGGQGSITVTTQPSCDWTYSIGASWIHYVPPIIPHIACNPPCPYNPPFKYTVDANTGSAQRTGTITLAGQTVAITEAGTSTCSYTLSPSQQTFTDTGGSGTFQVLTAAGCPWSVVNSTGFATLTGSSA